MTIICSSVGTSLVLHGRLRRIRWLDRHFAQCPGRARAHLPRTQSSFVVTTGEERFDAGQELSLVHFGFLIYLNRGSTEGERVIPR